MNCKQYEKLLSPYLDGVLQQSQLKKLERHLRSCPSCRKELEALRQTIYLLQAWSQKELELPPGFEKSLRLRLEQANRPWQRYLSKNWLSLSAAVVILLLVVFSAYGKNINILEIASPPSTFLNLAGISPDSAAFSDASAQPEEAATMLKDEGAAPEYSQEDVAAGKIMMSAETRPTTDEEGAEITAEQLNADAHERESLSNGSSASRAGEPPGADAGEITTWEFENPPHDPDTDNQIFQKVAETEKTKSTGFKTPISAEDCQGFEILLGKEKVPSEVAAWAEKNKKKKGAYKTVFNSRNAYLIGGGEKSAADCNIRFKSAVLEDTTTMVMDFEFVKFDLAQQAISGEHYPYIVFTVPQGISVKIRLLDQEGVRELTIGEI